MTPTVYFADVPCLLTAQIWWSRISLIHKDFHFIDFKIDDLPGKVKSTKLISHGGQNWIPLANWGDLMCFNIKHQSIIQYGTKY